MGPLVAGGLALGSAPLAGLVRELLDELGLRHEFLQGLGRFVLTAF